MIVLWSRMVDILVCTCFCSVFFFFKQKTAYEMRISDWSSDVCSSDLFVVDAFTFVTAPDVGPGVERRGHARLDPLEHLVVVLTQIGRASCRERVCQYV